MATAASVHFLASFGASRGMLQTHLTSYKPIGAIHHSCFEYKVCIYSHVADDFQLRTLNSVKRDTLRSFRRVIKYDPWFLDYSFTKLPFSTVSDNTGKKMDIGAATDLQIISRKLICVFFLCPLFINLPRPSVIKRTRR